MSRDHPAPPNYATWICVCIAVHNHGSHWSQPPACQLMRTPSSAVAGWFVVCGNEDMEPPGVIERQKNIIVDDLSAVSFLSSSNSVTDGGNDNNTSLSNSTNSSDAVNSVADFILKLQQTSSHHNSSDPPGQDLTNNKSARLSGSALDIAALRKSLTGRPRLQRICHICGRECPSRHKLQRHLSTHSEERPYNCSLCGKAFKWTEYLSKHMRTQHGPNNSTGICVHVFSYIISFCIVYFRI